RISSALPWPPTPTRNPDRRPRKKNPAAGRNRNAGRAAPAEETASGEEVLHLVRPGFAFGRMAVAAAVQRRFELAQQRLLLVVQAHRSLDHDVAVQVSRVAGAHALDALAAQPEGLAGLGAFRNGDLT